MRASLIRKGLAMMVMLLIAPLALADVVTHWNEKAIAIATAAGQSPLAVGRTVTIMHAAMFDAVNAIEGGYAPYAVKASAAPGSSAEAAAVAAAHAVLSALLPGQELDLDAVYSASLAHIAEVSGRTAGIAVGEQVAAEILARRAADGASQFKPYRPSAVPGQYVPTMLPLAPHWGDVTPWVMERSSQFRPGPPPELSSEAWAKDYDEVKAWGARKSSLRSAAQTDIGRFWVIVGPASWYPIVRQVADVPGRKLLDNARLFALVAIATADAYIAVFDAKYAFNFWRPITAIRNGDIDCNDATELEIEWEPLIDTPPHPEYPCAHCITSAAVATILDAEVGAAAISEISMTSPTAPGVVRRWTSTKEYVDEVSAARIYGGVHYRMSALVAQDMGRKIGELTLRTRLRPLP